MDLSEATDEELQDELAKRTDWMMNYALTRDSRAGSTIFQYIKIQAYNDDDAFISVGPQKDIDANSSEQDWCVDITTDSDGRIICSIESDGKVVCTKILMDEKKWNQILNKKRGCCENPD